MSYNPHHWCAVPKCKSSSVKTPGKLWIKMPTDINMKNSWLTLARIDPKSLSKKTQLYFCEDHFDLEKDMENYIQYKMMGSVKQIRMKPNCIPSRFDWNAGHKCMSTLSKPQRASIRQSHKRQKVSTNEEPSCSQGNLKEAEKDTHLQEERAKEKEIVGGLEFLSEKQDDFEEKEIQTEFNELTDIMKFEIDDDESKNTASLFEDAYVQVVEEEIITENNSTDKGRPHLNELAQDAKLDPKAGDTGNLQETAKETHLRDEERSKEDIVDEKSERRGVRTRGAQSSRGRDRGVRGAGSSSVAALSELGENNSILVPVEPECSGRIRGRSARGNRSIAGVSIMRVEDLPQRQPLERPLTIKRRRAWNPTEAVLVPECPLPSPSPVLLVECSSEARERMEVQNASPAPTPTSVTQYCADAQTASTSSAPISEPFIGTDTRPLRDSAIFDMLTAGSDEESSDSDEDEIVVAVPVPRAARALLETPEDEQPDPPMIDHISPAEHFPKSVYDFEWRSFPNPPIAPELRRESFSHSNCGPTVPSVDPYDIFIAMWDLPFMEHIASETNTYAQQYADKMINDGTLQPNSRICEWKETNADELYVYFAIMLAMGAVVRTRMDEYWCSVGNIFSTPGFRAHISLRRFQLLNKCLHFANSCNLVGRNLDASEAKLFKIQPVITHLNNKFSSMYSMKQNIALDESLLQWKGWLSINQFIPSKAAHVGIKSYELCESQSGYLWRFEIHAHQRAESLNTSADPMAAYTPTLVLRLVQGLEHRGHTLWMDNYYNSPALARKLKTLGFDCVGTLRTNRQYVPVELTNLTKSNMRPGELAGYTSGDVDLMVWRDQNRVATISTYHGNSIFTEANGTSKPILIRDYNVCMGGVDKKDQMLATYPIERKKTRVWYKKLFRRLLNVSVLNSYVIHKSQNITNMSRHLTHREFRTKLILTLLSKHSPPCPPTIYTNVYEVKTHYPGENPLLPSGNGRQRRVCVVCHKRTTTHCVGCGQKSVCAFNCFRHLHT